MLSGRPLRDVALQFGVSHETLRRALRHEGVVLPLLPAPPVQALRRQRGYRLPGRGRSRAILPDELADLISRHREGASIRALARSVGVSHETMRRTLAGTANAGAEAASAVAPC
jgi:lambda repressor-like predicted transcriptional regulator